ncbi:hypothetical protein OJ997_02455 [Solirubrobacter phytolaccae]|uniref:Uncharacterized protein n=1 Tax=Solirubrobacter phytolaccae TaxID=1404360 RepID=A0A9X3N3S1_9ACTN|nr:hypothetical protein [Solirubrobacter phytolaccae]MDA0179143.1 hypothetical protein [Solirubrobacter phytolaccae]
MPLGTLETLDRWSRYPVPRMVREAAIGALLFGLIWVLGSHFIFDRDASWARSALIGAFAGAGMFVLDFGRMLWARRQARRGEFTALTEDDG